MASLSSRLPRYRLTWPMVERGEIEIVTPLTPLEMSATIALLCNPNRILSTADLIECVWPDANREPERANNRIAILIMQLRRKGIRIANRVDVGYRLLDGKEDHRP
jgi:DNA-binding response OmpR family regulator